MSMPLICIVRLTALGKLYTRNGHVRTAAPASTPPMNNLRLITVPPTFLKSLQFTN